MDFFPDEHLQHITNSISQLPWEQGFCGYGSIRRPNSHLQYNLSWDPAIPGIMHPFIDDGRNTLGSFVTHFGSSGETDVLFSEMKNTIDGIGNGLFGN
jgi:hypothetical protein